MSNQNHGVLLKSPKQNRKRGCSSSSSASSRIRSYRFSKRVFLFGKNRRFRSGTPLPTWRTTPLRSFVNSPKYSQSGKSSRPVSARKLAASLWGMNESTSPNQIKQKRNGSSRRSETMDQSDMDCHHRGTSESKRFHLADHDDPLFHSTSCNSLMDIKNHPATSTKTINGGSKHKFKDITNALTTSKELLMIISRVFVLADQSSSSLSIISALHAELERAQQQVNCLAGTDTNDVTYWMKHIAEEKALWRSEKDKAIEAAVRAVFDELELERKLRQKIEILNTKLANELAETESSFVETVKELQNEKRNREISEQNEKPDRNRIDENNSATGKLRKQDGVFLGVKRDNKDEEKAAAICLKRNKKVSNPPHPFARRNVSAILESGIHTANHQDQRDGSNGSRTPERRSHLNEKLGYKLVNALRGHTRRANRDDQETVPIRFL